MLEAHRLMPMRLFLLGVLIPACLGHLQITNSAKP